MGSQRVWHDWVTKQQQQSSQKEKGPDFLVSTQLWRSQSLLYKSRCWRRLLRVPWTASRSNQSILKINPGISLEGMILKLKLQYFGYLMQTVDSLEKTLMLGGMGAGGKGDNRGWDGWMASLSRWTWSEWTPGSGDRQGGLVCCDSWGRRVVHYWVTELTIHVNSVCQV